MRRCLILWLRLFWWVLWRGVVSGAVLGAMFGCLLVILWGGIVGVFYGAIMGFVLGTVDGLLSCAVVQVHYRQHSTFPLLNAILCIGVVVNIAGGFVLSLLLVGNGFLVVIPPLLAAAALYFSRGFAEYTAQELSSLKTRNRHQVLSLH